MRLTRLVRVVRARTGLSQSGFAKKYRINVARLRHLEQGRSQPDSAMLAYLTVIAREPEAVERSLCADEAAKVLASSEESNRRCTAQFEYGAP